MPKRKAQLCEWITETLPSLGTDWAQWTLEPASSDASFRRYFRLRSGNTSLIAMDAPPERENCRPFVAIAEAWRAAGIQTPQVLACDSAQGFMLLSDFGTRSYLSVLQPETADTLYQRAIDTLLRIQRTSATIPQWPLPAYDEALLRRELALFQEWFCQGWLGLELSNAEQTQWQSLVETLCVEALAQPRVPVHRDYHSRNLMWLADDTVGVLDFQDAVVGPVSYDLVSLLRDCYIQWPPARLDNWIDSYLRPARQLGIVPAAVTTPQFRRWFDWMGMQRHLKAIGIFARLWLRDGKAGYLADIPRTLEYVRSVSDAYPELAAFGRWLTARVLPCLAERQQSVQVAISGAQA